MPTKLFTILLLLCFVLSVTVASASIYEDGFKKGSVDGKRYAQKDCTEYQYQEHLTKIQFLSKDKEYNHGYLNGFLNAYHKNRFEGLKR